MKEERRKQMGDLVARVQRLSMEQLRDHFGVSMNTIRADVAYLVQTGAVEKVYGGVRAAEYKQVPLFESRALEHAAHKRRIAAAAADLIDDRDIIFIDAGTTTMHLLDYLSKNKHITVVTASLYVIHQAAAMDNVTLIVLPGTANRRTNALGDVGTLEYLSRYRFNKAFMGVSGISVTPAREKNTLFTTPYCLAAQAIVVTSDSTIKSKADLAGKTVSVQTGTTAESFCMANGYTVSSFEANSDAQTALTTGKVDAWVIDDLTAADMVAVYNESNPGALVILDEAMTTEPYAFAFMKGSDDLVKAINEIINKLVADGTVAEIFANNNAPYTAPELG